MQIRSSVALLKELLKSGGLGSIKIAPLAGLKTRSNCPRTRTVNPLPKIKIQTEVR
jgi:hypothetical protein